MVGPAGSVAALAGRVRGAVAAALLALLAWPALAHPSARGEAEPGGGPETSGEPAAAARSAAAPAPSIASSLGPLGDPGGVRAALAGAGITYRLIYVGDALAGVTGARRGAAYAGRLDLQVEADLGRLAGLSGLTLHANGYQIQGRGLSQCCLENLLVASGVEALPATRLYELYLEQSFLGDRVTLRAGQLAADTEFLFSRFPALFVNSTYGWPAITAVNLPSGGPSYPLATPGVRVKVAVTDALTLRAALFNGDPAGPGDDPQRSNRSGTSFRIGDPPFLIGEARYAYNEGRDAAGLPGNVKVGAWGHLGRFNDQRFAQGVTPDAQGGLSLREEPQGGLSAPRLRGNWGLYGIVTQMVHRLPGSADQGVGIFVRVAGNPSDRNLIASYVDLGLTAKGLIPGRENDTLGVAYARANVSARAREGGALGPDGVGASEAVLALTYQAEIVPGWTVQPDLQYVLRPRGGPPGAGEGGAPGGDALVLGLRTTVQY